MTVSLWIREALLGAIYGLDAIPAQWRDKLSNCRPEAGRPHVRHPRPECFWPVDALDLAMSLIAGDMNDSELPSV